MKKLIKKYYIFIINKHIYKSDNNIKREGRFKFMDEETKKIILWFMKRIDQLEKENKKLKEKLNENEENINFEKESFKEEEPNFNKETISEDIEEIFKTAFKFFNYK